MRTLFLTIPYYFINTTNSEFLPPIHLVYLASFLKENGYNADIVDISADFGIQKNKNAIQEFKLKFEQWATNNIIDYDIIGLSCYTSFQYLATIDIANICKKVAPNIKIIVGGYHASALPNDFIFKGSSIDYCVIGEGENALVKILKAEENNQTINSIISEKPILNINSYNNIDFSILKNWNKYFHHYDYLSRGCPYKCKFCMEAVKSERRWRDLTIENALDKIEKSVQHILDNNFKNKDYMMFSDANFGLNKKWLKTFLEGIKERNYPIQFFASPRIDNLDYEILELMKDAKFTIDIPVEHGSAKILTLMNKAHSPDKYLRKASELMRFANELKLPFHTHWIFGYPGETRETINESLDFMKENHSGNEYGMTEIFLFKLYPGSWIYNNWENAKELGAEMLIPEYWKQEINIDENEYNIHPSFELKREDLLYEVNNRIKPFGKEINKIAIENHSTCCAVLKQKNAPWII